MTPCLHPLRLPTRPLRLNPPLQVISRQAYTSACDMWSLGVVAFALLCGELPFQADSRAAKIERISAAEIDFSSGAWEVVSPSGKSFVRGLLLRDPTRRITAEDALNHPWILRKGSREGSAMARPSAAYQFSHASGVLRSLQDFSRMQDRIRDLNTAPGCGSGSGICTLPQDAGADAGSEPCPLQDLKKVALEILAFNTPSEELEGLRGLFQAMDVGGSGTLSLQDFRYALSEAGTARPKPIPPPPHQTNPTAAPPNQPRSIVPAC